MVPPSSPPTPTLIHIAPTSASTSAGDAGELRQSILRSLSGKTKSLPTTILYDERGLELYDDITTRAGEHYYLFPAEEHILARGAPDVIRVMLANDGKADAARSASTTSEGTTPRGVLLELGSGSLRKTAHLISALADTSGPNDPYAYYALDLAPISLTQSLESLAPRVAGHNVQLGGLVTDYDSGLDWVRSGGLAAHLASASNDEQPTRGRTSARRSNPSSVIPQSDAGELPIDSDAVLAGAPLKKYVPTPTVLPEEGERVPNPMYPETPPHSISRDRSRARSQDGLLNRSRSCSPSSSRPEYAQASSSKSQKKDENTHDSLSAADRTNVDDGAMTSSVVQPVAAGIPDQQTSPPLHLLFLGSSLGNFDRASSAAFLRSLPLRPGSSDTLLLGLDGRNEKSLVERAYNDPEGYTAKFILNGLRVTARSLGLDEHETDFEEKFAYHAFYNEEVGRHEAYYRAKETFTVRVDGVNSISFAKDELVNIEYSYKYSDSDCHAMFAESNLRPITRWQDPQGLYSLWLLERPAFSFPRLVHSGVQAAAIADFKPSSTSRPNTPISEDDLDASFGRTLALDEARGGAFGVPTLAEYRQLWRLWDEITLGMIPTEMLHVKPIDLRHICLFYLGHIPAFLDIHLSRLLDEPHSEPEYFKDIFERGIDPSVDDPSKIHPHSEVPMSPEDWPSLQEIIAFRDRVRTRLAKLYEAIERGDKRVASLGRKVDRVLWMCYEHEGWHAETLLYMLIQKAGDVKGVGTRRPNGFAPPSWLVSSPPQLLLPPLEFLCHRPELSQLITLPAQSLSIGHDDYESSDRTTPLVPTRGTSYEFGWDNEHPKRAVRIEKDVLVEKTCITNAEYLVYFLAHRDEQRLRTPESWVSASSSALSSASSAAEDEDEPAYKVRSLYGLVPFSVAAFWPFVGSYDEIAGFAAWKGGRLLNEVELRAFMDRWLGAESSPIGFKEWTFIDGLAPDVDKNVRGHNGGVWEWSSTVLDAHPGFVPSVIYPGYTSDFFDGDHHVVLGGSFATIPRIAQRRTVRNYYQHNYRYAWVGGRVAYDA